MAAFFLKGRTEKEVRCTFETLCFITGTVNPRVSLVKRSGLQFFELSLKKFSRPFIYQSSSSRFSGSLAQILRVYPWQLF
jgi:hypothetical protein